MAKILVIDDDHDLAETIKSVLKYAGYEVLLSHEGKDGLIKAKEHKPDLILLDIMMPGMDGSEAVQALKSDPLVKDVPVIFLTGLISSEDRTMGVEGINIGGIRYPSMAKPFENEKLLKIIKGTLAK